MNDHITQIGRVDFRENSRGFGIRREDRRFHMLAIGRTGTGKSTLLSNLIRSDIDMGEGMAVFDPHGDLAVKAMKRTAGGRSDVVAFSPSVSGSFWTFNPLHVPRPELRHLVVSELITVFQHIWDKAWGPRMEYLLKVVLLSLTEKPGHTLLDALRMLNDKEFRASVVNGLDDQALLEFWENEFPSYSRGHKAEAFAPLQNKLGEFSINPILRHVIDHPTGTIDPRAIMDSGAAFIADLSVGRLGRDVTTLLGATLVGKFGLAALARSDTPAAERRDFYCYIDEFGLFASAANSIDSMLSEARKYNLNLILAMQYFDQVDQRVVKSLLGNIGTLVAFRVGAQDALVLEREFDPPFTAADLVALRHHHAYVRMMINNRPSRPFSAVMVASDLLHR